MKKVELYRSIEGIRPDRSMKNRIMTAVEANDKITVRKKPVFLPVAVAALLVINLGLIGNLMIGNDFNSKCNGADNSVYGNSMDEFSDYADKVYKEITEHDYVKVEYKQTNDYIPVGDRAWYDIYSIGNLESGIYETDGDLQYARYIQFEDGYYTNHEYIIGYDGNGFEKENIISITESNVNYSHEISEQYKNEVPVDDALISEDIDRAVNEYSLEKYSDCEDIYESSYQRQYDLQIFLFPNSDLNESDAEEILYRFPAVFSVTAPVEADVDNIDEYVYFLLNSKGERKELLNHDDYWKETISLDGTNYNAITLPNVVNADADNAVKYLKKMGFTNISKKYVVNSKIHNTVLGYNYGMAAGDIVKTDELIELLVCGKQMPDVSFMDLDEAIETMNENKIEFKIVYMNGAKAGDSGQQIVSTEPSAYEIVENAGSVKLYVESDSSSCLAAGLLWSEMELDYSYGENGIDYYSSDTDYPDVVFSGEYNGNGKVFVSSIYTKNEFYEMCPDIYVGMSLEEIDNQIREGFYYQDKVVSEISLIEYDSEIEYNYKFVYSDNDASYTVLLKTVNDGSFEEQIVSGIYVKKEPISNEGIESAEFYDE